MLNVVSFLVMIDVLYLCYARLVIFSQNPFITSLSVNCHMSSRSRSFSLSLPLSLPLFLSYCVPMDVFILVLLLCLLIAAMYKGGLEKVNIYE